MQSSRRSFLGAASAVLGTSLALSAAKSAGLDGLRLPSGDGLPPADGQRGDLYLPGSAVPGVNAPRFLLPAIDRMLAVEEGAAHPRIRILFEFWCPRSPALYERIRPMLGKARFAWIPIPAVDSGPDAPAAALFASGANARTLADVFAGRKSKAVDALKARQQGKLFKDSILPLLFQATALPFGTPSMIYAGHDGSVRIIRGAPDVGTLRTIVASAVD